MTSLLPSSSSLPSRQVTVRVLGGAAAAITLKLTLDLVRLLRVSNKLWGKDHRLPPLPRPTRKKRDEALKHGPRFLQPFFEEAPDVIVIGSGASGLIAASICAQAGKRVLVLEQHDIAGGCCHTYSSSGYEWDTGLHYVGEVGAPTVPRLLLEQATRGQLHWAALPDCYDCAYVPPTADYGLKGSYQDDSPVKFPMVIGLKKNEDMLIKRFPHEAAGIKEFYKDVLRQKAGAIMIAVKLLPRCLAWPVGWFFNVVNGFFNRLSLSAEEGFAKCGIKDPHLKGVLSYCWGDLGTPPATLSYGILCGLHVHFAPQGAFFPIGGSGYIPYWLTETVRAHGGDVIVRTSVDEILVDDKSGRACGVKLASGKTVHLSAGGHVVSTCGLATLLPKLLAKCEPKSLPWVVPGVKGTEHFFEKNKELETAAMAPGMATMSLFVGLENTPEELGIENIKENAWIFRTPDWDAMGRQLAQSPEDVINRKLPLPGIFVGFPSSKDPAWKEDFPGKSSVTVIAFVNWEWFKPHAGERLHHRSAKYTELKEAIAKTMWEMVLEVYPQLEKAKIGHFEAGSPLSNNYYINSTEGEIYGANHSFQRFTLERCMSLRGDFTGIPGLVVGGQDIICGGIVTAVIAGAYSAGEVMGSNFGNWLGVITAGFRFVPGFSL